MMVGWMAQTKVDWMVQMKVDRMVGCWADWMVQMMVGWMADQMVGSMVQMKVGPMAGWLASCLVEMKVGWMADWMADWKLPVSHRSRIRGIGEGRIVTNASVAPRGEGSWRRPAARRIRTKSSEGAYEMIIGSGEDLVPSRGREAPGH